MCPPYVGEVANLKKEILNYSDAILIYSHDSIDNPDDKEQYYILQIVHEIILAWNKRVMTGVQTNKRLMQSLQTL